MTTPESVNSRGEVPRKFYPEFKTDPTVATNKGKTLNEIRGSSGQEQQSGPVVGLLGLLGSVVCPRLPREPLLLRVCPGNSRFVFWIWSLCSYKEMARYQSCRAGSARPLPENEALKAEKHSEPIWAVDQTSGTFFLTHHLSGSLVQQELKVISSRLFTQSQESATSLSRKSSRLESG